MRFAADENFNNDIIRGLRRHDPSLDIVRVQDTEIAGAKDSIVLEWAAREGRLLLTHDRKTVPPIFSERVDKGLPVPGVFIVNLAAPIGELIEELALIIGASHPDEWDGQIIYIPMK